MKKYSNTWCLLPGNYDTGFFLEITTYVVISCRSLNLGRVLERRFRISEEDEYNTEDNEKAHDAKIHLLKSSYKKAKERFVEEWNIAHARITRRMRVIKKPIIC